MNTLLDSAFSTYQKDKARCSALANILFAEDDPDQRHIGTRALTRAGYAVTPVEDGQAALDELRAGGYDLLITDNQMPRLTGLELVDRMRLEDIQIPVIGASGSSWQFAEIASGWLSLSATLQKPFATDELLSAVREALHTSKPGQNSTPAVFAGRLGLFRPAHHWGINE